MRDSTSTGQHPSLGDDALPKRALSLLAGLLCSLALALSLAGCGLGTSEHNASLPASSQTEGSFDDTAGEDLAGEASPDAPAPTPGNAAGSTTGDGASSTTEGSASGSGGSTPSAPAANPTINVSVCVDGSRANSQGYHVSWGPRSVKLNQGATALDALRATGLGVSASGGYVSSVGGLAEFDCGQGSGWMYSVNGSFPRASATSYTLNAGDSVTWVYTLELGADVR